MKVDFDKPLSRLLVVSDVHAFSSRDKATDSVLDLSDSGASVSNPLADLLTDARAKLIQSDVLICAGDVCNRADAAGLTRAWSQLHQLREALGATELIATCGNHDLDSRYLSGVPDPDPKGALLALDPGFPFADEVRANKFWARNYAVVALGDIVLVNVNTSAYHGGLQTEIDHGRISKKTIAAIRGELAQLPRAKAYVLLCHHHPMPLSGWGLETDSEFLKNGQELLDALVGATRATWLVVHGHRHKPRLMQGASNSSAAPFVLGAGSLGARVPGVPNQFHLVSLYACNLPDHSSLVGTVRTWSWTDSTRWQMSTQLDGLPATCGFGYRGQIPALADSIVTLTNGAFAPWSQVRTSLPAFDLLMPQDMKDLEMALRARGVRVLWTSDGMPVQVGQ